MGVFVNELCECRQNIRELWWKSDELTNSFEKGSIKHHISCSKALLLKERDLLHPTLPRYVLESGSCLGNHAREACVFLLGKLVDAIISYHSEENCLQICGIQLQTKASNLIILSLYRAASRNLNQFRKSLYVTLEYLNYAESELQICSNVNKDYLSENY